MEQILIGEEISLLKRGRKVSGEIIPGCLHLLGSYGKAALGESLGCKYGASIRKVRLQVRVCTVLGVVVANCKNLSCFEKAMRSVGSSVFGGI